MKVKVTEKPGVWDGYVLVNDYQNPPYFAYEVVNEDGSKRFVPVLREGPTERSPPHSPLNLTVQRKAKITKFLKNFLKNPGTGLYLSKEWVLELVKYLDLFDEQTVNGTLCTVAKWLKNPCFDKLTNEIEKKCPCAAKTSEDGTPTAGPSRIASGKD